MKRNVISLFFVIALFWSLQTMSNSVITFFIRPFPSKSSNLTTDQLLDQVKAPGKISGNLLKKTIVAPTVVDGIFSTYWGYLALSNLNGQVTFPRKQAKDAIKLLITEKIKPVMMMGTTVHHWELDRTVPAQLFSIERKQDPETKIYFWDTKQIDLPSNNIIQLDTIVLFSKPKNIVVPPGITVTDKTPQLFLPDIYAKKSLNVVARALWVLTIKHFFRSLKKVIQKESDVYYSQFLYEK